MGNKVDKSLSLTKGEGRVRVPKLLFSYFVMISLREAVN